MLLRFALVLALSGAAASWSYRQPGLYRPLAPLETATADATEELLRRAGIEVRRAGNVLAHPGGFAYELNHQCTGAVVYGFLAVGLLALPLPRRRRLAGLAAGLPLVLGLNQLRLVSLYQIGVHWPQAFDLFHRVLWEAAMMALVLAVWLVAAGSAPGRGRAPASTSS